MPTYSEKLTFDLDTADPITPGDNRPPRLRALTAGDRLNLRLGFFQDEVNVTQELLESGSASLVVQVTETLGGGLVLAEGGAYTIDGGEAVVPLPLDGEALLDRMATTQSTVPVWMAVGVTSGDGTNRITLLAGREIRPQWIFPPGD
jgi:hypothetical protein